MIYEYFIDVIVICILYLIHLFRSIKYFINVVRMHKLNLIQNEDPITIDTCDVKFELT